jgi:hypothetical protein
MGPHDLLDPLDEAPVVGRIGGMRLVAADVDVRPGRQRRDLADHVVQEAVRELLVDAERAEADVDPGVRRGRLAVAVETPIRREGRVDVAGHVDLGHDLDEPRLRVGDDRAVLALGVETALVAVDRRPAADLREARPRADREPPALVVGQVQVEAVQLVERHQVDQALHLVDAEEVACDVEHHPAPGEARAVVDRSQRDSPRALDA